MSNRWYKQAVIYSLEVDTLPGLRRRRLRRLPGPDQPARLPLPARGDLPVAQPDPPESDARRRLRRQRLLRRRPPAGQPRRLRRAVPGGGGARHPDPARPGRQPHLRRAPVVPVARAALRTRRTATGTSGARPSRRTASRAWSSPASRRRRGPGTTEARRWYYHRFFDFQPDLNWSNPAVRARGQEDHRLLAAAGRLGLPHRRGAVHPRAAHAAGLGTRTTSRSSTSGASTCSGSAATPCCSARPTSTPTSSRSTPRRPAAARTTARTCCSPSRSTRCIWLALARRRRRAAGHRPAST